MMPAGKPPTLRRLHFVVHTLRRLHFVVHTLRRLHFVALLVATPPAPDPCPLSLIILIHSLSPYEMITIMFAGMLVAGL